MYIIDMTNVAMHWAALLMFQVVKSLFANIVINRLIFISYQINAMIGSKYSC